MRSVSLSNSVLVVTSPPDASSADFPSETVIICDQVNEIIELTPTLPKLYQLSALLKGREYDEAQQIDGMFDRDVVCLNQASVTINSKCLSQNRFTYEEALTTIQASDAQLDQGLKDRHILNINGKESKHRLNWFTDLSQVNYGLSRLIT